MSKKRLSMILFTMLLCTGVLSGCGSKKTITIYSCAEEKCLELTQEMLNEQFPEYNIQQTYIDTGSLAAKLAAEGTETDADILLELESSYLEKCSDSLASLDHIDYTQYTPDLVSENHKYVPAMRMSGAIVVDTAALIEKGIAVPTCYDDLLKPEYKGLISMPNPKSSSTGYIFLLQMINDRGEDAAFEYFDQLAENISGQGFTTSGSGPVKALVTREAAIALGMTFHAAELINDGNDFDILFFDSGAPYTSYSNAVTKKCQEDKDVMKVFDYICQSISREENKNFAPEPIFQNTEITMENFPKDIPYADMNGIGDIELKERLLDKWNH